MSVEELFRGVAVRWEDDRPFEISVRGHTDYARVASRVRTLLIIKGWRVEIGAFRRDQCPSEACTPCVYAEILSAETVPSPVRK